MKRPNWQWLTKAPLTPVWRRRLEVCLGVVMSSAAVVAMSTAIHVNPDRIARGPALQSSPPTAEELELARTGAPPVIPSMTPEFEEAVKAGSVADMEKQYVRRMPLHGMLRLAAQSGNKAAVDWLLERGASIHENESSSYAPVLAADAYPELAAYLRAKGAAEPDLEAAAEALAPHAVEQLLAKHPKMNERGSNPLRAAASSSMDAYPVGGGKPKDPGVKLLIVQRLIEAGADPNHESYENADMSALAGAIMTSETTVGVPPNHSSLAIVRLLLDHGARVTGEALSSAMNLDDEDARNTILALLLEHKFGKGEVSHALASAYHPRAEDVKRIIKAGGGVDWAWHDGEDDAALPVLEAVRRNDRDTVRLFLDAGAPADAHFKDGTSPLGVAIDAAGSDGTQARIVELLVTRGANVNRRLPDGRTPLFAAAEAGDLRTVNFLIERGARLNDRVLDDTALDAAEQNGHTPIARVLHAHGGQRAPKPVYGSMYGG